MVGLVRQGESGGHSSLSLKLKDPLPLPPWCWDCELTPPMPGIFMWVLGIQLRSLSIRDE